MVRHENPFETLGLSESASTEDIKKAYFQKVKQFTPEKHGEEFKQIREAYELLKDEGQRARVEIFHFPIPPKKIIKEVSPPDPKITTDVFAAWILASETDLVRKDFSSDLDNI